MISGSESERWLRRSAGFPVRKEFAAAQIIFSTEAVIINKALHDEKIFDSPLTNPFAQTSKVLIWKSEVSASGIS